MAKILFPCNSWYKEVDPSFLDEYNMAKKTGHEVYSFEDDRLTSKDFYSTLPINDSGTEQVVILRGWMLKGEQYRRIYNHLKDYGYKLINYAGEYLFFHLSVNALQLIPKNYTPHYETFTLYPSVSYIKSILGKRDCKNYIIKDYVKSVKTKDNLTYDINVETDSEETIQSKLYKFLELRGDEFQGGFVFKEKIQLKTYGDFTNEWRLFVLNNNILDVSLNTGARQDIVSEPDPVLINEVMNILNKHSKFYTVDFAEDINGNWQILETGDGQVSGIPETVDLETFYKDIK